jgi:hypothetical protein
MESGYTRAQKERLRKRKLKQALASQAKARAPGKKGMHGSTKELIAKVQGKPLGREMLEWTSIRLMQLAQNWPLTADGQPKFRQVEAKDRAGRPILDKDGKPTFNQVPVGDVEKFMEIAGALSLTSFRLARFQSPTLQAIPVVQQQSSTTSEPIHYEVHIHNARGDHIKTTIDGEVVEEPDMKLIESDRSDGPDA